MLHFLAIKPIMIVIIALILIFTLIMSLIALVDILRSDFKGNNDKLIWVLIVLFLGIIGALLYFIMGRGQKK
ncbi:MAG: PLDc N-terminal domain-containing protein [Muriicola sp.]|nr:PLDc N-terminal domain-containing protein [Muriicola sp.]